MNALSATAKRPATTPYPLHARHQALVQARRRRQARGGGSGGGGIAVAAAAPGQQQQQQQQQRTSLIPDTLREMAGEDQAARELRERSATAQGRAALSREERAARRRSLAAAGLPPFPSALAAAGLPPLSRGPAAILQLNVGLRCNQACSHCHVESSPLRTEEMSPQVAARCLELLARAQPQTGTLDLTGGAPELSPQFRPLVRAATAMGVQVIDRCNLTVLTEPGQEDLAQFLAEHGVRVVASLPCYGEANVDAQRGRGVFERSVEGLRMLNAVGYGMSGRLKDVDVGEGGANGGGGGGGNGAARPPPPSSSSSSSSSSPSSARPPLQLDLVYNPGGAFLAPASSALEPAYRRELREAHGVEFDALLCLNNLPVKRFADWLARRGETEKYLRLLVDAFNPAAAQGLMCRDTVSVSYDGSVYDCDFNQQLGMAMMMVAEGGEGAPEGAAAAAAASASASSAAPSSPRPLTVFDIEDLSELEGRPVATDAHCYGCTAGQGSGCQGATTA